MMEINLLLRLLTAHLLTDFVFQPYSWVEDRKLNKIRSGKLLLHVLITTLVAYVLSGCYSSWVIPVVIFISHYLIDLVKSYLKDSFTTFIADQAAHILVILILWLSITDRWSDLQSILFTLLGNNTFWIIASGYIFVSWPLSIIIGKGTQKWRDQIALEQEKATQEKASQNIENGTGQESTDAVSKDIKLVIREEQGLGLASAGKWIGICERILILTFVLMQQYTAIGFLIAAKSILRFSEKEANTQLKTEYVLVGTLVSFTCSAMIGVLLHLVLKSSICH